MMIPTNEPLWSDNVLFEKDVIFRLYIPHERGGEWARFLGRIYCFENHSVVRHIGAYESVAEIGVAARERVVVDDRPLNIKTFTFAADGKACEILIDKGAVELYPRECAEKSDDPPPSPPYSRVEGVPFAGEFFGFDRQMHLTETL